VGEGSVDSVRFFGHENKNLMASLKGSAPGETTPLPGGSEIVYW
jgi:hypothetical protein